MIYIWVSIAILFMMLENLQPKYNYICFSLGALLAALTNYFLGNYLFELVVFLFSGTGFILWLKPLFHFHQKK